MSTQQGTLNFLTTSPINIERLSGQNKRLYDYLVKGNTIHCFHPAKKQLRIGYLNSRISDLVNKYKIEVDKKFITVKDDFGEEVDVTEYSYKPNKI